MVSVLFQEKHSDTAELEGAREGDTGWILQSHFHLLENCMQHISKGTWLCHLSLVYSICSPVIARLKFCCGLKKEGFFLIVNIRI